MRLALAQINPTVGDIAGNGALIETAIARARDARADLVVCPELAICGYPPKDLLFQEGFVAACAREAKRIGETRTRGITAIVGVPLPVDETRQRRGVAAGASHNALVVYRDGKLLDYYDKRLLPTYDVFDEDRYFAPGDRAVVVEVAGVRVGLAICEDLWRGEDAGFSARYATSPDPVAELVGAGATTLVVPSASPFVLGKGLRHRALLSGHARANGVHVAAVNQVGGNDELIFDGHSTVHGPTGALLAASPGFEEHLLIADVPSPGGEIADPRAAASMEELTARALILGVRDYLRKTGFARAIVGISGGVDSAVTAAIAACAMGPRSVLGVAMPGPYSSDHALEDAIDLADRLGIERTVAAIGPAVEGFRASLDPALRAAGQGALGESMPDAAEENVQSRARGAVLMALSNRTGAMVLTTGNKSELAVGYCTLYGDMNGGLAVLSDVPKTQVYALARWLNANFARVGLTRAPIPQRTIEKAPSAELRPDQTDMDSLPPYDVLDEIAERHVEGRQSVARIVRETGHDAALVGRVVRMIDTSEFKRKQMATGLKIRSVAFGVGRRWPIAQRWRDA